MTKNDLIPSTFGYSVAENPMESFPMSVAERLTDLRKKADLTQVELASRSKIPQSTLVRYEKGGRISEENLSILASIFDVRAAYLAFGVGRPVAIAGYVGAGAVVYPVDDMSMSEHADEITPPFDVPLTAIALRIKGDSMYPEMDDGDVLIYDRGDSSSVQDCLGKRCLIYTDTQQLLVKRLTTGSEFGTYDLISVNAPPRENVKVTWATPILGVVYR